jgi:hypothetical protein
MAKKRKLTEAEIATFMRQYGRKRPRSGEPNDRRYSHDIQERLRHMDPEEIDALLHGQDDEPRDQSKNKK